MNAALGHCIVDQIPAGSRVLDCGCGDGELLATLRDQKQVVGYGIDQDPDNVQRCIEKGVSVYHGDIAEGVGHVSDKAFDVVVLSFTLQQIMHPVALMHELCRVGKKAIVTFPNFAHWRNRFQLLSGLIPQSRILPYSWHDTPNIRVVSAASFKKVCEQEKIEICAEEAFSGRGKCCGVFKNSRAEELLYVIKSS